MRVITGTARGRKLITLEGEDVRPTGDKAKEGMFSAIQFEIEGRRVLDLFAGSGQLGIEALSRGAKSATFVDKNKKALEVVRENLKNTGLSSSATLFNTDSFTFVKTSRETFNIAFLDPPYAKGILQQLLPLTEELIVPGGVIICEHPYGEEMPEELERMKLFKVYKHGKTAVSIYR